MTDYLDLFIRNAMESVAEGYYEAEFATGFRGISLAERIRSGFSLIAELKRASPEPDYSYRDIDAAEAAVLFAECGADAMSVVVEPKIFKGRLQDITKAKTAGLPVLFKDFVVAKAQIAAASAVGADAVLLVVKVAERVGLDLPAMIDFAHRKGIEVVLETSDELEMRRALESEADIIGINNRDLETLKTDIKKTMRMMERIGRAGKPVISESGFSGRDDIEFARKCGVDGVLVGSALWKTQNIREKIRELRA